MKTGPVLSILVTITCAARPGQPFKLSLAPTAIHFSAPDEAAIATQEPKASFPARRIRLSSRQGIITSGVDRSFSSSRSGNSPPGRTSSTRQ